ncbi:MAG TPA: RsmD family RNA methyltransferase, partial [Pirellulales bacterium]|nr:RsmD family RNA methyltransferase [Pirellulales bacterium]
SGDRRTRPMKDRVREAVFNLLGPGVAGKHAIDLFAGSGALGLEALSRGAAWATFIEQHFPTAALIRENAAQLGVADRCDVLPANAFIWAQMQTSLDDRPWVVFCSPPFAFFIDRQAEMLALIERLLDRSPPESDFVIESDKGFDVGLLSRAGAWDIREYPPAVVALYRKAARPTPPAD